MIASLKGKISHIDSRYIVLDVNNIGYKIFLANDTIHGLKIGTEKSFWIYQVIREDAMDLYGFVSKKEEDFFELLISVSGIGPKSAINILSLVDIDTLANAIKSGSTSHLVKVSGIGRKTAEKIAMELKDKLGNIQSVSDSRSTASMSSDMDVIEALKALGYDADDAREALKKVDKDISDTGAKVKAALKILN
jgi:holliday junction DNA helicase RuvA